MQVAPARRMRLLILAASSACVGCVSLHPSALSGPPQRARALGALPPDLRGEGSEVVSAPVAAPRASSRPPGILSRVVPCLAGDTSPSVSPAPLLVRATAAYRAGYPAAPRVTFGPPPVVFLDPWYCRYYSRGFFTPLVADISLQVLSVPWRDFRGAPGALPPQPLVVRSAPRPQ